MPKDERGDQSNDRRCNRDLKHAQAEDEAAHRHEALKGQLQADKEQQEDDAKLSEMTDGLAMRDREKAEAWPVGSERAEPLGAQDGASRKKSQYRADA